MLTLSRIIGDYEKFILDLLEKVKSLGIEVDNFEIDHLCYRVKTLSEYEEVKAKLMSACESYVENIHHDRPITKFIFKSPLVCGKYKIPLLELPAPKTSQSFNSGLEHFEMVVGEDFGVFKNKYSTLWSGTDDSGEHNQPVYITFGPSQTVKFHRHSLIEVLKKEGKSFTKC